MKSHRPAANYLFALAALLINGCATPFVQLYEGPQRAASEVALFMPFPSEEDRLLLGIAGWYKPGSIQRIGDLDYGEGGAISVEILPGIYPMRIFYNDSRPEKLHLTTITGTLVAEANSVYCWSFIENQIVKSEIPYEQLQIRARDRARKKQSADRCRRETELTLDLEQGLMNGVSPSAALAEIRKQFPFYTGYNATGSGGIGVFFRDHDFFAYTDAKRFEVRSKFRGNIIPPIMNRSNADVVAALGPPDRRVDTYHYVFNIYKRDYGHIVVKVKKDPGRVFEIVVSHGSYEDAVEFYHRTYPSGGRVSPHILTKWV